MKLILKKTIFILICLVMLLSLSSCSSTTIDTNNIIKTGYGFINTKLGYKKNPTPNVNGTGEESRGAALNFGGYWVPYHDEGTPVFDGSPILITTFDKFHSWIYLYINEVEVTVELKDCVSFLKNPYMWITDSFTNISYSRFNLAQLLQNKYVHFVRLKFDTSSYVALSIKWERVGAVPDHWYSTYSAIGIYPDKTRGNNYNKPNQKSTLDYRSGFNDQGECNINFSLGFSTSETSDAIGDYINVKIFGLLSTFRLVYDSRETINALNVCANSFTVPNDYPSSSSNVTMETNYVRTGSSANDSYWHGRQRIYNSSFPSYDFAIASESTKYN